MSDARLAPVALSGVADEGNSTTGWVDFWGSRIAQVVARVGHAWGMVLESPIELAPDVATALVKSGPDLEGHQALLLPRETRNGQTFYVPDDLDALDLARSAEFDLGFLHGGAERRYLHENAAGWELTATLAVAESVGSAGILGLIRYLWIRVHHAKEQGLYEGEESAAPIKVTVARVRRDGATGDVSATAVQLEGQLDDVSSTLNRLLGEP